MTDRDDLDRADDVPFEASDEASEEDLEVAEIRADIEDTRVEMGGTLRELGDRLEPAHLMNEAKENVRDATIGRVEETAQGVSSMVLETIKRNPVPAALAGAGIALLWMNRAPMPSNDYGRYPYDSRRQDDGRGIGQLAGRAASGVGDTVGGAVDQVGQTASQVGTTVQEGVRQASFNVERLMDSSPLAMAAIAAGAGAVVGALLPETPQERELLGDASRQIGEKVRETVEDVSSQAEEKIDDLREPAGISARSTGSSSTS